MQMGFVRIQNETILAPHLDVGECRVVQQFFADDTRFIVRLRVEKAIRCRFALVPQETETIFRHSATHRSKPSSAARANQTTEN
jgi:hypothetical protein